MTVAALHALVVTTTQLCAAVERGRRVVASARGTQQRAVWAWRRDLEALGTAYRAMGACGDRLAAGRASELRQKDGRAWLGEQSGSDGSGQIVREEEEEEEEGRGGDAQHEYRRGSCTPAGGGETISAAVRSQWLSALRRQLPKLTEPHLAAALIDATLSVERIPASDGLPPAVGVLEAPKNTSRALTAAAAALSLRALGALYPSYVAPLAA